MKNKIMALITCLTAVGCTKQETGNCIGPYQYCYLKATVAQESDISCYKPLLDFTEDSTKIKALTDTNGFIFSAIGLEENLNIRNKKLYVSVRLLQTGEFFPCNDLGIYFYPLKVLDAKARD